jgi:hypothetical protein
MAADRGPASRALGFRRVSFHITKRKSYGYALSLEDAKAAFRAEYETWKNHAG